MRLDFSARGLFCLMAAACFFGMLGALYFQYGMGLEPCPLCMTQRVFMSLLGIIALLAVIHQPQQWGERVYAGLTSVSAIIGGAVSARQLWLQSLPEDQVPACGPPLEYIVANFPLLEAIQVLFTGDGNCAEVTWQLLGFSMPAWVLLMFMGFLFISIFLLCRPNRKS